MTFPYPSNPRDWQKAYSREHANLDSQGRALFFFAPVFILFVAAFLYLLFFFRRSLELNILFSASGTSWLILVISLIVLLTIAACLSLSFALRLGGKFLRGFYQPPDHAKPVSLVLYRLLGRPLLPPPLNILFQFRSIQVNGGEIEEPEDWPAWLALNMGGPLSLSIFDGSALYLERGNRFSRVVGPGQGLPFLELNEVIKYVVDLRPTIKTEILEAWTKDGIKVTLHLRVGCRIGDPANKNPGDELVYPFDPEAVRLAVESYAMQRVGSQNEPVEINWEKAALNQAIDVVLNHIGNRFLDDLLLADRQKGQILSSSVTHMILEKVTVRTEAFGVYITDLQVFIDPPDLVKEQHVRHWGAERQSIATVIDGKTKAFNIRAVEKARAEAQRDLIIAIADGLKKNQSTPYTEPLLLSLSSVLDDSLKDPQTRAHLARETLETLDKLREILDNPSPKVKYEG